MKRLSVALLVLSLAGCTATAQHSPGTLYMMPPAELRARAEAVYRAGDYVVHWYDQRTVETLCRTGRGTLACAVADPYLGQNCVVFVSNNVDDNLYRHLIIHEIAHCVGWPPNHRNYVWQPL